MRNDAALIAGCMSNASLIADLEVMMRAAGFEQIRIQPKDESMAFIADWAPGRKVTDFVVSRPRSKPSSPLPALCLTSEPEYNDESSHHLSQPGLRHIAQRARR